MRTLIEAAKQLPKVNFVFAGNGEYAEEISKLSNAINVGFKSGIELDALICNALFTVCPSECYENCPFSVMESQERRVPVLGARIGGIPELIKNGKTGWLFESGNVSDLKKIMVDKIDLIENTDYVQTMKENLKQLDRNDIIQYDDILLCDIY